MISGLRPLLGFNLGECILVRVTETEQDHYPLKTSKRLGPGGGRSPEIEGALNGGAQPRLTSGGKAETLTSFTGATSCRCLLPLPLLTAPAAAYCPCRCLLPLPLLTAPAAAYCPCSCLSFATLKNAFAACDNEAPLR
jgi:hypothetical protein